MINKAISFGINEYKRYKNIVLQTAILFSSQIIIIALGILIKSIQTRALTPADYGIYAFFGTVTGFSVLFFRFGFFTSIKVLLANNKDEQKEKELFGTGFIIAFVIGVFYLLFIWGISFFVDSLFNVNLGGILRIMAPLCIILPFNFLIPSVSIGSNKVNILARFDIFSKLLFLILLGILFFYDRLSIQAVIGLNLSAIILAIIYTHIRLQPKFSNLKARFNEIWRKNKEYGLAYYSGAILNQTTYKFDEIFITYFINATQLGYYTLAAFVCSPMAIMSQSFTNALFKKFATKDSIPKKVFIYNAVWLIVCMLCLYLFSKMLVNLLFGEEYLTVANYIVLLSFAYLFQGLYTPFTFLSAKSKGKEIRNVAILEAVINIVGNMALIPILGVIGAIWASIVARGVHFGGLWYYYRKYLKELHKA